VCCSVLQCVAVCNLIISSRLGSVVAFILSRCCSVLQYIALCVLQCCAVCSAVRHLIAFFFDSRVGGGLHFVTILQCVAVCCNVLQCVAVCCSVLQCAVVCCSVSPHRLFDTRVGGGLHFVTNSERLASQRHRAPTEVLQ